MYTETKTSAGDDGKPKRDEWMLVPPKSEDWTAKVDPTKLKNRKFQTGKGAKAPQKPGSDNSLWTESPEERRKRLNDEVMGIKKPATQAEDKKPSISAAEAEETARRIREYNVGVLSIHRLNLFPGLANNNIRTKIETNHSMMNTRHRELCVRKKTIQAPELLIAKRTLLGAERSDINKRRKCCKELHNLETGFLQAAFCN